MKALFRRAKAHVGAWNPEDARKDFERAMELDPSLAKAVKKELQSLDELQRTKDQQDKQKLQGMFDTGRSWGCVSQDRISWLLSSIRLRQSKLYDGNGITDTMCSEYCRLGNIQDTWMIFWLNFVNDKDVKFTNIVNICAEIP